MTKAHDNTLLDNVYFPNTQTVNRRTNLSVCVFLLLSLLGNNCMVNFMIHSFLGLLWFLFLPFISFWIIIVLPECLSPLLPQVQEHNLCPLIWHQYDTLRYEYIRVSSASNRKSLVGYIASKYGKLKWDIL